MAEETIIQTTQEGIVDTSAMNPEAGSTDVAAINPEVLVVPSEAAAPQQPVGDMQAQQINVMNAPVTMINTGASTVSTPPLPQGTAEPGKYEEFLLMPEAAWPPPIFIRKSVSAQERFYIENRWHSQWSFYDKKANESKNKYFFYQSVVVIGSVVVPVVISFSSALAGMLEALLAGVGMQAGQGRGVIDLITVFTSTSVAISAAVESLNKFGDNWSSYRSAAEELQAEKYFYDMLSGPYANNPNPFATFVERTEGIIANQNGKYFQVVQQQIQKQSAENNELLDRYKAGSDTKEEAVVAG